MTTAAPEKKVGAKPPQLNRLNLEMKAYNCLLYTSDAADE